MKIGNSGRFILVFETLPNFMLSALFFNSQAFVTVLTISTLGNGHFLGKTTQKWDVLKHVSSIAKALDSSQACRFVMMSLTPNFKWYSSPRLKNPNWLPNLCGEKMSYYLTLHNMSSPYLNYYLPASVNFIYVDTAKPFRVMCLTNLSHSLNWLFENFFENMNVWNFSKVP